MTIAITNDHSDRQDFEEDVHLLQILRTKLFRRAVYANHQLPDLPDIESLAGGDTDELAEAIGELEEARQGRDPVTLSLHKWRTELAA